MSSSITVRGSASSEEIAAVLAVVRAREAPAESPYERWRRVRLTALLQETDFDSRR